MPATTADLPASRPGLLRLAIKLLAGVLLAGGFLYWFLRGTDLAQLGAALAAASPLLLALAFVLAVSGFAFRAERWRCYLRTAREVSFGVSFDVMMMGYAVNMITGRLGDLVVRPLLMRQLERIPAAVTLATVAVERLFDIVTVLLFLAFYLVFFAPAGLGVVDLGRLRLIGGAVLGFSLVVIIGLVVLSRYESLCLRWLDGLAAPLPQVVRRPLLGQARTFAAGLQLFRDLRNALRSIALSFGAWLTVGASMWLVAQAFQLDVVRVADAALLMALGALGIAVPTPGGAGSVSYALLQGFEGLGVTDPVRARAAALTIWLLTPVPVAVLGILAFFRRGVSVRQLEPAGLDGEAG